MSAQSKIGPGLQHRLETTRDYELLDVNIFLKGELAQDVAPRILSAVDTVDVSPNRESVLSELKQRALAQQADLVSLLKGSHREVGFADDAVSLPATSPAVTSFWINNAVGTAVHRKVLEDLLRRPDVLFVEIERHVDITELLDAKAKKRARKKMASRPARQQFKTKKLVGKRGAKKKKSDKRQLLDASTIAWSVTRINAPLLWQHGITGKGIVVAMVDTGVNYRHPDLAGQMWNGGASYPHHGYDFENGDNDPMDSQGHGTATAGQVAGNGNAGTKTGVAPEATIMAIRVGGAERNFWNGLQFALDHGANVISMSMSWKYPSSPDYPAWRRTCESILAAGVLHANSIGNQGDDLATYPIPFNIATPGNCPPPRLHPLQSISGGLSSAISCGAIDDLDRLAVYSGRGPAAWEEGPFLDYPYANGTKTGLIKPDLCAPGPGTTSCSFRYPSSDPGVRPYVPFGGTSAATPHVGGCLALLAQACRSAGQPIIPARLQEALENTAVRIAGQAVDKENHFGAGRVDVYAAYQYGHSRGWW